MNKTYYGKFAVLSKIKKPLEIYNLPIPNLKKKSDSGETKIFLYLWQSNE